MYAAGSQNKGYGKRKYARDCDRVSREFASKNISPTDLAWAAGIVDGEGCILIGRIRDLRRTPALMRHVFRIDVVNTDPRMIEKLHALFGGWAGVSNGKTAVRKTRYRWLVSASTAVATLRLIAPYIVAKPEEVQTALNYAATVRGEHVDEDVIVLRENYRQDLMRLHHWRAEPSFKQKAGLA
jgi:hypothetical protein